jgi:hypothetical protein
MATFKLIKSSKLLFVCLALLTVNANAIPLVKLIGPDTYDLNETFVISVYIDGITDYDPFLGADEILAFGFDVVMPSSFIYIGATLSPGFTDDSALLPNTDIAAHTIPGIAGNDILLASLSFSPTLAGKFNVGISSDPLDPNEGLFTMLYREDMTSTISVTTPEPSSLRLLGLCLVFLFIRKQSQYFISR